MILFPTLGDSGPSLSGVSFSRQMEFSLYIISHVGMAISLVCLVLAIATFLLCQTIRNRNTYLHLHLCVCLFLAKVVFLTGIDKTDNQVSHPLDCVPIRPHHLPLCLCSQLPNSLCASSHLRTFTYAVLCSAITWPATPHLGGSFSCRSRFRIIPLMMLYIVMILLLFKPLVLTWDDSAPREHLAIFGDVTGCHHWEGVLLASGEWMPGWLLNILYAQDGPPR